MAYIVTDGYAQNFYRDLETALKLVDRLVKSSAQPYTKITDKKWWREADRKTIEIIEGYGRLMKYIFILLILTGCTTYRIYDVDIFALDHSRISVTVKADVDKPIDVATDVTADADVDVMP